MAWAELPPLVIEKIISFAVKGDQQGNESKENFYAKRVIKYGQVNPTWREAIRFSRNIFHCSFEDAEVMAQQLTIGVSPRGRVVLPKPFVDEGYLQAVKTMTLCLYSNSHDFDLPSIHSLMAARNSVELFSLSVHCQLPKKMACQIIKLLKQLKDMSFFMVQIKIETQTQAEWLWQVLQVAIHTTSRPKTVSLEFTHTGNSIDWSFINRNERLQNGSIKTLVEYPTAPTVPTGFFSNLAEIDTISVILNDELFWHPRLEKIKAKHLKISCCLRPDSFLFLLTRLLKDDNQRAFKVDAIECLIMCDMEFPVPQPKTFKNDAEVWVKMKDWFLSIVENYRLFIAEQFERLTPQAQENFIMHQMRQMQGLYS